jgi:hypothetical protein
MINMVRVRYQLIQGNIKVISTYTGTFIMETELNTWMVLGVLEGPVSIFRALNGERVGFRND